MNFFLLLCLFMGLVASCQGGGGAIPIDPIDISPPSVNTPLSINKVEQLIGGPAAESRIGDQLLENDRIRVAIQQPGKYPGIHSFGGIIIDADLVRTDGSQDNDNFGALFPLINVEWTINTHSWDAFIEADGSQVVRTYGTIDVYDYLDVDFLGPISGAMIGQSLYYSPRFDDMNNPFATTELKNLATEITTDYRLAPNSNVVEIVTTFENIGNEAVYLPVGDFLNGSGQLELLIPGLGFSPELIDQVEGTAPAIIYTAFPDSDVSYGYFYKLDDWLDPESGEFYKSTSLSFSGITGLLLGETFLNIFPLGGGSDVNINFSIPPHGKRTVTRYFVVGDQSAGSVLDAGLKALNLQRRPINGKVINLEGNAVSWARVAVINNKGKAIITYTTNGSGAFHGELSTGAGRFGAIFGNGHYTLKVDKSGYYARHTTLAGSCDPEEIDLTQSDPEPITCTLGNSVIVTLNNGITDATTGEMMPGRLTIVGFDPSSESETTGIFSDSAIFYRPFGIVDVKYINANGGFGLGSGRSFRLEPGRYLFVFSRGLEYSITTKLVNVPETGSVMIEGITLQKVLDTTGYLSADFHLHSIASPDSSVRIENRALQAACEGMDVLHSSDHDALVNYAPVVKKLASKGWIKAHSMHTIVGDEISPNGVGHIHAFPLEHYPKKPKGGAMDWSLSALDVRGPQPDYMLSIHDIIERLKQDPGEEVIQINHVSDNPTSLIAISGLVTSTAYVDSFGILPLSTYSDPVMTRFEPYQSDPILPIAFGQSSHTSTEFTAIELSIGPELATNKFFETGLPEWFNLLNLGYILTATANSDSHTSIDAPVGLPRNYVASPIDPTDGTGGSHQEVDSEMYAEAINNHRLTVSAGPFITMTATNEAGQRVTIGETISGKSISLQVNVSAPHWTSFDRVEIYANTDPTPASDETLKAMKGAADNPATFFKPYHIPKFIYKPTATYTVEDGSLQITTDKNGSHHAQLTINMEIEEDTWIVAVVRATPGSTGYKSLFPLATDTTIVSAEIGTFPPLFTLDDFHNHPENKLEPWAFTNPIFVDTDGDTNLDGKPFEARFIRNALSPIR